MLKLKIENSPLLAEFKKGAFGIKRTTNKFSRIPVDLTLEQTINANAASSMTGVTHFSNSISARQRWALSHSIRTKVLDHLFEEIQLSCKEDTVGELAPSRIQKDKEALDNIVNEILKYMNPFVSATPQSLFNISTGRAATTETTVVRFQYS